MAGLRICPDTFRRYPCAWWFVWLVFIKGLPAVFKMDSTISKPETVYASWTLRLWGIQLVLAGVVAAIGLATYDHKIQHWGFLLMAVATAYNLAAIFYFYGFDRPAYTMLYIGFTVACVLRSLPSYGRGSDECRVRSRGR